MIYQMFHCGIFAGLLDSQARIGALLFGLGVALASSTCAADAPLQCWQVARPQIVVAGAPRHSDVSMRSLHPHPAKGNDPYDTLETARQLHLTRLEWTYSMDEAFVKKAKALGFTVGGALEDEAPDAQGLRTIGRVTGENGELKKHRWFPEGRWVGCANAPEFMEATFRLARQQVDAGVDVMQQDDPQMAVRCVPPLCFCNYCKEGFVRYQAEHGANSTYEQFQKDSVLAFHRELHRRINAYAGHHIPFSHNFGVAEQTAPGWISAAFDYVLAETWGDAVYPPTLYKDAKIVGAMPLSFQYRETTVANNRKGIASIYAIGATVLMPWDVYISNTERYFGKPADYADLSAFIRGNARYLDGYEDAAVIGAGLEEKRYGAAPMQLQDGSGRLFAFARAKAGASNAPVAIHLVEWSNEGKPATLRLRTENFFGGRPLHLHLRTPVPYEAKAHDAAQRSGNFESLIANVPLKGIAEGEFTIVQVPPMHPWGIIVVQP